MERNLRKTRTGKVVSNKMDKTIVVAVEDHVRHPLYKKIVKRTYKLKAHDENNVCNIGDTVKVMETRPISKDKMCIRDRHRGPMTHGSKYHRHAGSNGSASDPSKVFKGKKMPGHMGAKKVTVQNLEVVRADAEKNLLLVKGAVPGPRKALVIIKETVKTAK